MENTIKAINDSAKIIRTGKRVTIKNGEYFTYDIGKEESTRVDISIDLNTFFTVFHGHKDLSKIITALVSGLEIVDECFINSVSFDNHISITKGVSSDKEWEDIVRYLLLTNTFLHNMKYTIYQKYGVRVTFPILATTIKCAVINTQTVNFIGAYNSTYRLRDINCTMDKSLVVDRTIYNHMRNGAYGGSINPTHQYINEVGDMYGMNTTFKVNE